MAIRVVASSTQGILGNDGPTWAARTSQFSFMWWDRLSIGAALGRVFQVATSGASNRIIVARAGGGLFTNVGFSSTSGDFNVGSGLPDDGGWHCFHYIYDASSTANKPTLYVDGQATAVTVVVAPAGSVSSIGSTDFSTYGNRQTLASPLVGALAHLAMWPDHLLTVEDVAATLKRGPLACGVRPALYYPFDPTAPGGILTGRGTLTPANLPLRANSIFPFLDGDDPYHGAYVGGRRWRGHRSPIAFAASGITGTSSATFALTGSAAGTVAIDGDSAATLALTGSAAGTVAIDGDSTATLALTGSAAGTVAIDGDSTATLALTGSAAGTVAIDGDSSATFALTGTATGTVAAAGTTTGSSSATFVVTGTATGTVAIAGASSATFAITGTSAGTVGLTGTSSATFALTGSAAGTIGVRGASTATFDLGVLATGTVAIRGASSATFTLTGSATGVGPIVAIALTIVADSGPRLTVAAASGRRFTVTDASGARLTVGVAPSSLS